jgi:hypothetical protein
MWRLAICVMLLLLPEVGAASQPIVVSSTIEKVAVTIYRDQSRRNGDIDKNDPKSIALISETRTLDLPPGPVTIRFEGVAGAIVPQTAIIIGTGQRERNREAALLSQGGLVDAFTGQQVVLRRTNQASGEVTEEAATIRSAANRMIISTRQGSEAVYCSGLSQSLIYPNAPATLSAKPVLTMTTLDQPGGKVTMTLAYLATGFDWDANYVATLSDDRKSIGLFSWLTMVSNDETSFIDATTSAIAGNVNRSNQTRDTTGLALRAAARSLNVTGNCWPSQTTSTSSSGFGIIVPRTYPQSMHSKAAISAEEDDVFLSGSTISRWIQESAIAVTAASERIGDLVLYKIPIPVTIAARSQKQVAFLADKTVKGEIVYQVKAFRDETSDLEMVFRFTNDAKSGLGDPLPAGALTMYQMTPQGRHLIGETRVANRTKDEEVELYFGDVSDVTYEQVTDYSGPGGRYKITNNNAYPIRFELEFSNDRNSRFKNLPRGLIKKPGKRVWSVMIPANGKRFVTYESRVIETE